MIYRWCAIRTIQSWLQVPLAKDRLKICILGHPQTRNTILRSRLTFVLHLIKWQMKQVFLTPVLYLRRRWRQKWPRHYPTINSPASCWREHRPSQTSTSVCVYSVWLITTNVCRYLLPQWFRHRASQVSFDWWWSLAMHVNGVLGTLLLRYISYSGAK